MTIGATRAERGSTFAKLHDAGCFVIANAWDAGSARVLVALGYKALATTSAGFARSLGRPDYLAGRDAVLAHCSELCAAVDAPVSADLENGFGDAPETAADTIRLAAQTGLCGGSIEDFTGDPADPIYDLGLARERIRAASEAARAAPHRFMLTARAENYLRGRVDLADTIARLQAYQEAGADVLFAPGLRTSDEVRAVCGAVDRPVNILRGPWAEKLSVPEIAALGVRRISVGGMLHTAAMTGMIAAAREMLDQGGFGWADHLVSGRDLDLLLAAGASQS